MCWGISLSGPKVAQAALNLCGLVNGKKKPHSGIGGLTGDSRLKGDTGRTLSTVIPRTPPEQSAENRERKVFGAKVSGKQSLKALKAAAILLKLWWPIMGFETLPSLYFCLNTNVQLTAALWFPMEAPASPPSSRFWAVLCSQLTCCGGAEPGPAHPRLFGTRGWLLWK